MTEENKTFPTIPGKQWWTLRLKFRQKIPSAVTLSYLATALNMKENSAKANILPSLTLCKIVDESGKPTERATRWRDDEQYPKLCEELRQEIYPTELLEALPPPSPNRDAVEKWFANRTGVGEAAARRMAVIYLLLCEAEPTKQDSAVAATRPISSTDKKLQQSADGKKANGKKSSRRASSQGDSTREHQENTRSSRLVPSIHIDIQIHLDPEAPASQIDQIFASMAKHLSGLINQDEQQSS